MHVLVVHVPLTHSDAVREALATAGAGKVGAYDSCSFSSIGTGRFRPLKGANPTIGTVGEQEEVTEERIEVVIPSDIDVKAVVNAVKEAHPYETPSILVMQLWSE